MESEQVQKKKNKTPMHPDSFDPVAGGFVKEIWLCKPSKKLGRELWHKDWIYYRHRGKLSVTEYYKKHFGRKVRVCLSGRSQPYEFVIGKEHYNVTEEGVPIVN